MKLLDLEPRFQRIETDADGRDVYPAAGGLVAAQGLLFLCPVCFTANGGPIGTHSVLVWFRDRGVPDAKMPGPGRWTATGTGYLDLTLSPSIHLSGEGGCGWHGQVTAGEVT